MTDILRKWQELPIRELLAIDIGSLTGKDAVAVTTIIAALDTKDGGSDRHYIYDRIDGRPKQSTELSTPQGFTLEIVNGSGNGDTSLG